MKKAGYKKSFETAPSGILNKISPADILPGTFLISDKNKIIYVPFRIMVWGMKDKLAKLILHKNDDDAE